MARDIIAARPRILGCPFVFAGRDGAAFNAFSDRKSELDAKLPVDMRPWVIHDLRRTSRSLLSRAGIRPDVAEKILGHTVSGVERIYDRYLYRDEKTDAVNRLAALIETIISQPEDKVVP